MKDKTETACERERWAVAWESRANPDCKGHGDAIYSLEEAQHIARESNYTSPKFRHYAVHESGT